MSEAEYAAWSYVVYWAWMAAEEGDREDFFFEWYDDLSRS